MSEPFTFAPSNSFGGEVLDLLYVLMTVAFFTVMLAYVRGCSRLGRGNAPKGSPK
jgi:hypothetical protein